MFLEGTVQNFKRWETILKFSQILQIRNNFTFIILVQLKYLCFIKFKSILSV